MSSYTYKNEYKGINAHLHSYFQSQGGWASFHTNFIAGLAHDLNARLPDDYIVDIEQSLQIREYNPDSDKPHYSAVVIYRAEKDSVLGQPVTRRVDYDLLPLRFDRYTPADQERIRTRMNEIKNFTGS